MDGGRFDTLAKLFIDGVSRRWTLTALLGATVGVLGLDSSDKTWAASSGKCKKKCNACERCDKGKCEKKDGKKKCKKGKCKPKKGLENCASGQVRNLTTCGCCSSNGQSCSPAGANTSCCSELCVPTSMTTNVCVGRPVGAACEFGAQCANGSCTNGACE